MSKNMLLNWVEPKQTLPKERQRFGNRGLFALILPILVEQLLTMLVGIADTLMGVSVLFRSQLLSLLFGRVEADVMEAPLTYLVISALSFPALAVSITAQRHCSAAWGRQRP